MMDLFEVYVHFFIIISHVLISKKFLQIKIVAHDEGEPPLLSTTDLKITIVPVSTIVGGEVATSLLPSDKSSAYRTPASFLLSSIAVTVDEDSQEGHVIAQLQVKDKPKDFISNLRCSILETHLHGE